MVPTWIAVREHTPVEAEKNYGSDEEQTQPEDLNEDDKNKLAVAESTARWLGMHFLVLTYRH